jgi:exodeoxyribonuclease-3
LEQNKMRLISWNVNGIRAVVKKGFFDWFVDASPDVLCVQETKAHPDQLTSDLRQPSGYHAYWNAAQRKGYSGVTTWSVEEPLSVEAGFGVEEFDVEGRVLMAAYPDFKLFNVYFPNGRRDLARLDYKQRFYAAFLEHCAALHARGERLIVCGDFNTAHQPIDLARPKQNQKTSGFLPEEREWLDRYLTHGFVDTFRALHPDQAERYTWWMYMRNARARNIGWRIDYFIVSEALMPAVTEATILSDVMGSDHCPTVLELDIGRL